MAETRWTPLMVEARFEEAASTLRRLPDTRVPGYFNTWPPIVRSVYEAFGWERARMPRIAPTPAGDRPHGGDLHLARLART